jgi:predicted DsbA family dithiol-disulfide isomerase
VSDESNEPLELTYYSDVLCVFAYASEVKLKALQEAHGGRLKITRRVCDSFGNTATKIGEGWREKGGWEAYADHVSEIAARFDHIALHADVWRKVRPASSYSPHLLLKALEVTGADEDLQEKAAWGLREAFFGGAEDIGRWEVQRAVLRMAGIQIDAAEAAIWDGRAFAALAADLAAAEEQKIEGSPSFVLPDDRQKLYGDVGFRILDANVRERLRRPEADEPAWC